MRARHEFSLYSIAGDAVSGGIDATLALLGSQGWEMRGISTRPDGSLIIALQRPLDEQVALPDASVLAATLSEPLTPPSEPELKSFSPHAADAALSE